MMSENATEGLTTPLGRSLERQELLNLVDDGPHILIAGTSGAGKSELLKSLLLGWASRYGPDELNYVLFDFKGGSAFHLINRLEHSLGLVTDLSQAQAERTLEGVHSELKRRERLFLEAGTSDYAQFRREKPHVPLARIVIVIDEFRILSHELPETMDELMRLATLGRSLGLHLVLSTQRPQGVVTADIRANIGSVLSLRLRSGDESKDLVGTTAAASIDRNLPGRGILRRPGEKPVSFQAAQLIPVDLRPALRADPPRMGLAEVQHTGYETGEEETATSWTDRSSEVVSALQRHMNRYDLRRSHTPLLPPLPPQADVHPERLSLGLLDMPSVQRQEPLRLNPHQGQTIGLIGDPRSGSTEALTGLAEQLLGGEDETHLYLFDGDQSLQHFQRHLRVGSWVTPQTMDEAEFLLERLSDELARRKSGNAGSSVPLFLLFSDYAQWHRAGQMRSTGGFEHDIGTLVTEGRDVGFSAVFTGNRELSGSKLGSRISTRIYLPYGTSDDAVLLWPKLRPVDPEPGRGVYIDPDTPPPGWEIQLISAQGRRTSHAQADPALMATQTSTDDRSREGTRPAIQVTALPERLSFCELSAALVRTKGCRQSGLARSTNFSSGRSINRSDIPHRDTNLTSERLKLRVPIGVEQFTWAPAWLSLETVSLLIGPGGSGKTNCLHVLGHQLRTQGVHGVLKVCPGEVASQVDQLPELPSCVLADDAHQYSSEEHRLLERFITRGVPVVAAAAPVPSLYTAIPWAHHARTSNGNMLLSPTHRSQAESFAAAVPLLSRPVPGRAVHLRPEGPCIIQWASEQKVSSDADPL